MRDCNMWKIGGGVIKEKRTEAGMNRMSVEDSCMSSYLENFKVRRPKKK